MGNEIETVIRKLYINYDKEEKWLTAMSVKGLALKIYSWCRYVFEDCEPGEFIYRIEFLENLPSQPESREYIRFMEETGAEYVTSYARWSILGKSQKKVHLIYIFRYCFKDRTLQACYQQVGNYRINKSNNGNMQYAKRIINS